MTEETTMVKSGISEEMRLALQNGIIEQHGKYFTCEKCKTKRHILDLKEHRFKLDDRPILRYLCPECGIIAVEATS